MAQNLEKTKQRDPIRYARLLRTAKIIGVSPRQVRRVCDGENENPLVFDTMIRLAQAEEMLDNLLLKEVKKLIQE